MVSLYLHGEITRMARVPPSTGFLGEGEKDRHPGAPYREQTAPLWACSLPDIKQGTLQNPHLAATPPPFLAPGKPGPILFIPGSYPQTLLLLKVQSPAEQSPMPARGLPG